MARGGTELEQRGWDAIDATDWELARECFEQACEEDPSADALDGLGRALHFLGEYDRAIELTERAFAAYVEQGRVVEAADRARWLAFLHGAVRANLAVGGGWMARAEAVLREADEGPGHGWLALDRAPFTDDPAERARLAAAAMTLARRYGDVDLEYDAMALLGESQVALGRVQEGMRLLDQAMTAVSAGEITGIVALSDVYCRMLGACELALDVRRAEQWMAVVGDFEAWRDFVSPVCRNHYGGILLAVGRLAEAEEHLLSALRTFERSYRLMATAPLLKLADLRLRQGRLEEAQRLLEGQEPHPLARRTLAAVALARGDLGLAEDLARLCLDGSVASDPACAPALDLLVAVRVAREDLAGAAEASDRLRTLAADSGDPRAAAFADLAGGRVRAAQGDERATADLQSAMRRFAQLDFRLETARAQLALAGAIAGSSPDAAAGEARSALRAFETAGARADADAAGALLRRLGAAGGRAWPKGAGTLTRRETEVLELLGEGCSNAQIAERLVISRRTAEHHVASVLSKLGLRSRAEAAAHVARRGPADP